MAKTQRRRVRRVKKNIARGVAHIHSTFNNTIVTITDEALGTRPENTFDDNEDSGQKRFT